MNTYEYLYTWPIINMKIPLKKFTHLIRLLVLILDGTVCPGSSDPSEKIFNIFASENEVYTIY